MVSTPAPWSFVILPDDRALITQTPYPAPPYVLMMTTTRTLVTVNGLPLATMAAAYDIILSPNFASDRTIFLSYAEKNLDDDKLCLAVMRVVFGSDANGAPTFSNVSTIWRQVPKLNGTSNFGGKLAFSPDGRYLFITSGDRSELLLTSQDPNVLSQLQRLDNNLGKTLRIFPDGTIPNDNPYASSSNISRDIWTTGHRNSYGIAFDTNGHFWENENGPAGGDEFNLILAGQNYGWPLVSWGNHYDGGLIAKPSPGDGYIAPSFHWLTAIAPAGLTLYKGGLFSRWRNDMIQGSLVGQSLQVMHGTANGLIEADRVPMGTRIRDIHPHSDGSIWVLEDGASGGRLLRLTPSS